MRDCDLMELETIMAHADAIGKEIQRLQVEQLNYNNAINIKIVELKTMQRELNMKINRMLVSR